MYGYSEVFGSMARYALSHSYRAEKAVADAWISLSSEDVSSYAVAGIAVCRCSHVTVIGQSLSGAE